VLNHPRIDQGRYDVRITMIGGGYVGLVSGACFAEFGTEVTVVETNAQKLAALREGRMPIYEPGLEELVQSNVRAGRLAFTGDLATAVAGTQAVFIAVGTPTRRGDGHADLSYVYAAAEQVARALTGYAVVVTKSTVPVGTGRRIQEIIRSTRPDLEFDVASNPEFLREGNAIGDFMRPDRVVIGAETDRAREVLRVLYRPLYLIEAPIVFTTIETAELTKYAANAFLAMKVTFINEMADLCEKVGADVHDVARGIGLDGRIGRKFLHPGPGYGGSCFPKDTLALVRTAQDYGAPSRLVEATVAVNDARKSSMAMRVIHACGGSVRGKTIADPEGMEQARPLLPESVIYCTDALDAASGADALVLITEWNEFRALPPARLGEAMRGRVLVDLRNVYDPVAMRQYGFTYHDIGRAAQTV
jgi:UDPglucose 6-dehydrogenase